MRYIFWLLIIFNISAFMYFTVFDSGFSDPRMQSRVNGRPLVMLQEEEPPPVPDISDMSSGDDLVESTLGDENDKTEQLSDAPLAPDVPICYSVSPFEEEKDTLAVIGVLKKNKIRAKSEEVVLRIPTGGYWVFLAPLESRTAAKTIASELAGKGVADYYILTGGEYKNAISLGLYSGKNFAEKRASIIRGYGYDPIVSPRYRVERHFAVKYVVQPSHDFDTSFSSELNQAGKGARQEIIDCVSTEDLIE